MGVPDGSACSAGLYGLIGTFAQRNVRRGLRMDPLPVGTSGAFAQLYGLSGAFAQRNVRRGLGMDLLPVGTSGAFAQRGTD